MDGDFLWLYGLCGCVSAGLQRDTHTHPFRGRVCECVSCVSDYTIGRAPSLAVQLLYGLAAG